MRVREFATMLGKMGVSKVYLIHYDHNEALARRFAAALEKQRVKVTVAADARKLGYDFVTRCIQQTDISIVLNPDSNAERLVFHSGQICYEVALN